jgi:hypothetical protein
LAIDGTDAGKSYYFKISSVNTIGESELSEAYLVVAATIPEAPTLLTRNELLTTKTVLSFDWSEGVSNGGSDIIDYKVEYDQSMDTYVEVASGLTVRSFTTTYLEAITAGNYYKFKVYSRNAVGYSDASEEFTILAAILPGACSTPITYNDGTNVYLRWSPPSDDPVTDYGEPIRGYRVEIRHQDGVTYSIDLGSCDGENDQSVIASASCIIPMSTL